MINNTVWGKYLKSERIWVPLDAVLSTENTILRNKITHYLIELEANRKAKYTLVFNTVYIGFFYVLPIRKCCRSPPLKDFIKKSINGGQKMADRDKYKPLIKATREQQQYYIKFEDVHGKQTCIQVTEAIFLQFFGIHRHVRNEHEEHYYIVYESSDYYIKKEVTKDMYYQYQSFKSMDIHEKNIFDRYIEHKKLSEAKLYQKSRKKDEESMIDHLYKESVIKTLYQAVASLPEVQKRRLLLHYQKGLSLAQIAQKERCSKSSVQGSIRIALNTLREKLNKFRI